MSAFKLDEPAFIGSYDIVDWVESAIYLDRRFSSSLILRRVISSLSGSFCPHFTFIVSSRSFRSI